MVQKLIFASLILTVPLQAEAPYIAPEQSPYTVISTDYSEPYILQEEYIIEEPLPHTKPAATLNITEINPHQPQVSILSDVATAYNKKQLPTQNMALKNVKLAVDADNITLKQILQNIIAQAEPYTGPWEVKWRLKPENQSLLNQKVNLIAEGTFNDFVFHLTDRVRNMTGTQIFVTHFDAARVIIVSDTYY